VQAPFPSHVPSWPQLGAPSSLQSECGSVPVSTGPQVPSGTPVSAPTQAAHAVPHALSQQTPSTQKVDAQADPALHGDPIGAPALPPPVPVALAWPP